MTTIRTLKTVICWSGKVFYSLSGLWLKTIATSLIKFLFILLVACIGLGAGIYTAFIETFKFIKREIEV